MRHFGFDEEGRRLALLAKISNVLSWVLLFVMLLTGLLLGWNALYFAFTQHTQQVYPSLTYVSCLWHVDCRPSYWHSLSTLWDKTNWAVPGLMLVATLLFRIMAWLPEILLGILWVIWMLVSAPFIFIAWTVRSTMRTLETSRSNKAASVRLAAQAAALRRRVDYSGIHKPQHISVERSNQQRVTNTHLASAAPMPTAAARETASRAARDDLQAGTASGPWAAKDSSDIDAAIALVTGSTDMQTRSARDARHPESQGIAAARSTENPAEPRSRLAGEKPEDKIPTTEPRATDSNDSKGADGYRLVRDTRHDRWLIDLSVNESNQMRLNGWAAENREKIKGASSVQLTLRNAVAEYIPEELTIWTGIRTVLSNAPEIKVLEGEPEYRPSFPTSGKKQLPARRYGFRAMQHDPDLQAWVKLEGARIIGHPASAATTNRDRFHAGVMYAMSQLSVPLTTVLEEQLLGNAEVPAEAIVERGQRRKYVYFLMPRV